MSLDEAGGMTDDRDDDGDDECLLASFQSVSTI